MAKPEPWVAALPMYNLAPALRRDWQILLERVAEALASDKAASTAPVRLSLVDAGSDPHALHAFWRRPDVLLTQTCGYPLMRGLARHVHLVGTPSFAAPGCGQGTYASAVLVRDADGPASLAACRGVRAAYNNDESHSGLNALRHAVAPLAREGRFFGATMRTGSHLASMEALVDGEADVAAIDCVTLAFARDHLPERVAGLRQIATTRTVAALPFVASRRASAALIGRVRQTLTAALDADRDLGDRLRLRHIAPATLADYLPIAAMARSASSLGYSVLR
jgi:ABC-type phosphate/phosphonate transport system substrate-binding protein